MLTNFKRAFHFALQDFFRNKGMTLAAIFVLTITILLVTGLFFLNGINDYLVETIENKIDITAYFKTTATETDILQVKKDLLDKSPEIKSIKYVSREEALAIFNEKHKDNETFAKALSEVGDNPFFPSLNIITVPNAVQYQQIASVLEQEEFASIIEKVDFSQKRDTIEKVFAITSSINKIGIGMGIVLMLIAVMVVLNTIKLIIESSKEEIATMRIVGASSWFVRAPFVIEGALFGVIALFIAFIVTFCFAFFVSGAMSVIMPGFSLFGYFFSNIFVIILLQIVVGVGLGVVSSFIVVAKYLKESV